MEAVDVFTIVSGKVDKEFV